MILGLVRKTIESKLNEALSPTFLEVVDESAQHHGHSGARPDGESHFRVKIAAPAFKGKSRVEQHRMINQVLAHELQERVHALVIEVLEGAK
jgi:BolA protein